MIYVRVDDFPHTKGEPQHTRDAFRDFHKIMKRWLGDTRYLLGVIPKRCGPDDILLLRNETDCVIGLHGITHDEKLLDLYQNEFPPFLTKQNIRDSLAEAKSALEIAVGRPVRTYMPPRNRIDQRTASILNGLFDRYTAGPETDLEVLQRFQNYHHSRPPYAYGRSDELLQVEAGKFLSAMAENNVWVTLTLHWTWEVNIGLSNLDRFLQTIPRKYLHDFPE